MTRPELDIRDTEEILKMSITSPSQTRVLKNQITILRAIKVLLSWEDIGDPK